MILLSLLQANWHFEYWEYLNLPIFIIQKYFPISISEYYRNYHLQNQWMLDLEDLHSFISNHFISTSHCQWTWIIILSVECIPTECNGLQGWKIYTNHFIQIHSILSIMVELESKNAKSPNVMDCRFGRSSHSNIQYQFNTSNHKGTGTKIIWFTSNGTNLNGL